MATAKQQTVDPNVAKSADPSGNEVTTLDGLFAGEAVVVDQVMESPLPTDEPEGGWWIIRPNTDIEHMSVGTISNSYSFEAGRRYKVPWDVVNILGNRDYLLEVPTRYQP